MVHDVASVQVQPDRVYLRDVLGETWEIPYPCWVESVVVATQRIALRVNSSTETMAVAAVAATVT